jgi:hypothetical protein
MTQSGHQGPACCAIRHIDTVLLLGISTSNGECVVYTSLPHNGADRSLCRWIFPVAVRGNSATSAYRRGSLDAGRLRASCSRAAAIAASPSVPAVGNQLRFLSLVHFFRSAAKKRNAITNMIVNSTRRKTNSNEPSPWPTEKPNHLSKKSNCGSSSCVHDVRGKTPTLSRQLP